MKYSLAALLLMGLLLPVGITIAQSPGGQPCGDKICDAAEQANPNLCPQDCGGTPNANTNQGNVPRPPATPTVDEIMRDRAMFPQLTQVERWVVMGDAGKPGVFAPDIVPLYEGGYRIFWNDFQAGGITSATTSDGITFVNDDGLRLANGSEGDLACIVSHPWVIQADGGYRLYYQADAVCRYNGDLSGLQPEFRILSAFSTDGLTFEPETGIRVDIGEATGLDQAAHGRVIQLADGTYRMFFSASFRGDRSPADLLGATSTDGLTWALDQEPTLLDGHDPTLLEVDEMYYMYASYRGANLIVMTSPDGYTFTPAAWVEFFDTDGTALPPFGDVEILHTSDGQWYLYGTGPARPLTTFIREE